MPGWKLVQPGSSDEPILSAARLARALDILKARREERPFIVELTGPSGALAFGVGREETFLSHTPANLHPPYHMSRGSGSQGGVLVYFYGGAWTEIGTEAAVPWPQAIRALLEFYESGRLGSAVEWAEV